MATNSTLSRRERRKLADLKDFPLQAKCFPPLPEHKLRDLADDIRLNGLKQPIEVLPENDASFDPDTILYGHQRRAALQFNGETEGDVIVRHDLAAASREYIEWLFLADNANRRQLNMVEEARIARMLIEREKTFKDKGLRKKGTARDRVGQGMNKSGRNLQRYIQVIEQTPDEVANALGARKLTLGEALAVARLDKTKKDDIAFRLRSGEAPKDVVRQYLPQKDGRHTNPNNALGSFVRNGKKGVADLDGRIESVSVKMLVKARPDLKKIETVVRQLIARSYET